MLRNTLTILSVVIFMFILSCGNSSTEPKETEDTVTDIDGNVYQTIQIGDQLWMAENLKVTHYQNGDLIPNAAYQNNWTGSTNGALCSYENDTSKIAIYGLLYNWYAGVDSRSIAPKGWHVPSKDEFNTLIDFLGEWRIAGGKLKEAGLEHWQSPNTGATNESGFAALPAGYRTYAGPFDRLTTDALFWSTDLGTTGGPEALSLNNGAENAVVVTMGKTYGFSIRCVKD